MTAATPSRENHPAFGAMGGTTQPGNPNPWPAGAIQADEAELAVLDRWMKWKHGAAVLTRVTEKLEKAQGRHQRGTTLTLTDVQELLGLVDLGGRPGA